MDSSEMKTLEHKTRAIVEALSELEGETQRQKNMSNELEQSRSAIQELVSSLTAVSEKLAEAVELLQQSTLADSVTDLNARLDRVEAACAELQKKAESESEAASRREIGLEKRLDNLEAVIGRIDRNTQKGFGKERS